MRTESRLGEELCKLLREDYTLQKEELGADAHLKKNGMAFDTEAYSVEGLGHLCVMKMNAILGLMKMETVVLAVTEKDVPLFNLDYVSAFGKETQFAELYDTQLSPWPESAQAAFEAIRYKYAALPDSVAKAARWYDAILYPCSCRKTGKGLHEKLDALALDYLRTFAAQLKDAPACDAAEKRSRVRGFAERLFAEGGPAVDQVTKLFGRETASRLILRHMYGVKP